VHIVIFENAIDTFLLDALFAAPGAVFPKFYGGVLTERLKPRWSCLYMDVILLGHINLPLQLMILD
jgi:hypothetical protein